jgi:hypothetical protein
MSDRKFFSGLPEKMMTKHSGPNRQQTNFFWPNDSEINSSAYKKLKNKSLSTASLANYSQASTDTDELRHRRTKDMKSKIEFYDMIDTTTDTESVYSRSIGPTKNKKLETLKSRIEFYDYEDVSKYDSEEDKDSVIEVKQCDDKRILKSEKDNLKPETISKNVNQESAHIDDIDRNMKNLDVNFTQNSDRLNNYMSNKRFHKNGLNYDDSFSETSDDERRRRVYYKRSNG